MQRERGFLTPSVRLLAEGMKCRSVCRHWIRFPNSNSLRIGTFLPEPLPEPLPELPTGQSLSARSRRSRQLNCCEVVVRSILIARDRPSWVRLLVLDASATSEHCLAIVQWIGRFCLKTWLSPSHVTSHVRLSMSLRSRL